MKSVLNMIRHHGASVARMMELANMAKGKISKRVQEALGRYNVIPRLRCQSPSLFCGNRATLRVYKGKYYCNSCLASLAKLEKRTLLLPRRKRRQMEREAGRVWAGV